MDGDANDGTGLLSATTDRAFATWNNILVVIWRGECRETDLVTMGEYLRNLGARYPRGLGLCAVVEQTAPPPSSRARKTMGRVMSAADMIRGSIVIFDGTGFRAAIVRSFVVGLNMLTRLPFPHKVYASAQEGIPWLATLVPGIDGAKMDAGGFTEALGAIRLAYTE